MDTMIIPPKFYGSDYELTISNITYNLPEKEIIKQNISIGLGIDISDVTVHSDTGNNLTIVHIKAHGKKLDEHKLSEILAHFKEL